MRMKRARKKLACHFVVWAMLKGETVLPRNDYALKPDFQHARTSHHFVINCSLGAAFCSIYIP